MREYRAAPKINQPYFVIPIIQDIIRFRIPPMYTSSWDQRRRISALTDLATLVSAGCRRDLGLNIN